LGIAQRTITTKYAAKSKSQTRLKPLVENAKTVGDWIKAQREQKNLNPGNVASKMGIAQALVLAWENNTSEPDKQQWAGLARTFGFDTSAFAFPPEFVKQTVRA
jgi:ribosome-binding protein aMBF1 (putative translation factor)